MTKLLTAALAAALLAMAGCGAAEPAARAQGDQARQDPKPAAPTGGPGAYTATTQGGLKVTADVPADPSDPAVAEVERYRQAAGAPPLTYVTLTYDNTKGRSETSSVLDASVQVVGKGGGTVSATHVARPEGVLETRIMKLDGPMGDKAYAWYQKFYEGQSVLPGAKETAVMAAPEKITDVSRVFVVLEDYGQAVPLRKAG